MELNYKLVTGKEAFRTRWILERLLIALAIAFFAVLIICCCLLDGIGADVAFCVLCVYAVSMAFIAFCAAPHFDTAYELAQKQNENTLCDAIDSVESAYMLDFPDEVKSTLRESLTCHHEYRLPKKLGEVFYTVSGGFVPVEISYMLNGAYGNEGEVTRLDLDLFTTAGDDFVTNQYYKLVPGENIAEQLVAASNANLRKLEANAT